MSPPLHPALMPPKRRSSGPAGVTVAAVADDLLAQAEATKRARGEDTETGPIKFTKNHTRYGFLSNLSSHPVTLNTNKYYSAEHAFQASRTSSSASAEMIRLARTPLEARKAGKDCVPRNNWGEVKDIVMKTVISEKVKTNPELEEALLATKDRDLIAWDDLSDEYWCGTTCDSKNKLGKLWMEVRTERRERREKATAN